MTDTRETPGLDDDPFAEHYEPGLAFAVTASAQAQERHALAARLLADCLAAHGSYTNPRAASGRKSAAQLVVEIASAALQTARYAEQARVSAVTGIDSGADVSEALSAFGQVTWLCTELVRSCEAAATPDVEPPPYVEPPLPTTADWATTATRVARDTIDWANKNRGQHGQLLVLKPSPSSGKTESMCSVALQEQKHRQRVVFAARTKEVLTEELEPRVRTKNPYVRLHVITGRDEKTCLNWDNVRAVQEHGYAPGRAVCLECEHHPRHAPVMGLQMCDYYESRIRAQNESQMARRGLNEYPLILTTHSALVTAFESGGGMYGKFWGADLVLIDEDPTASFEPTIMVTDKHCEFSSGDPIYRAQTFMAAVLKAAIDLAQLERKAAESRKFKDLDGQRNAIHRREESLYAGKALHELLFRVATGHIGQALGIRDLKHLLRDVADTIPVIGTGSLLGATTTEDVNMLAPHAGLGRIAELLFTELALVDRRKVQLYRDVRGHELSQAIPRAAIDIEIDRHVDAPDTVYQTRLEWTKDDGWRFVLQDFSSLNNHNANIVIGDAYAHVEHYRQMFDKPETMTPDPVTVVKHVAHFPPGSLVVRVKTPSSARWLDEHWGDHAGIIASVLPQFAGKKVLIYGHKKFRERFEKLMAAREDFGIEQWVYEHWWGGRGKDQYRYFDAVVCISDPVQNVGGMLHTVNARALRDLTRHATKFDAIADGTRITSSLFQKHSLHDGMRNDKTHWRVRQEHQRQNVDELQQALHRPRPYMAPKIAVHLGQEIELSADTLAGAVTMLPKSKMSSERGTLRDVSVDGYLTSGEIVEAIRAVEEWYGVWSPAFNHALLPYAFEALTQTGWSGGITIPNCINNAAALPSSQKQTLLSNVQLIQRIWTPGPYWDSVSGTVGRNWRLRTAVATMISDNLFRTVGYLRPAWWPASKPDQGYRFYSTRPLGEATRIFMNIINNQYGPTRDGGVVYAPNAQPFVPF